jgi:hypothetical protein
MWFLGQLLHAVEFAYPVSCIHSFKVAECVCSSLNVCGKLGLQKHSRQ